ncbi:MAG TPA: carbamoyltransferase C-terminal domain-containing protein, partial [Pseudolabrys sp.]|nr:carbamoyltransferase C-terminal domain-containing protein [Pseudolabrys sp.]
IPAVVHVDNSARPQIIERNDNPLYHDILGAFERETRLPVLVNTSSTCTKSRSSIRRANA